MNAWQESTREAFEYGLNVLPPASMNGACTAFQVGEAASHKGGRPTFEAFKVEGGFYFVSAEALTFREFKAEFPDATYGYEC